MFIGDLLPEVRKGHYFKLQTSLEAAQPSLALYNWSVSVMKIAIH